MISKACYDGDHAHCGQWLSCNCPCHHSEDVALCYAVELAYASNPQRRPELNPSVPGPEQVVPPGNNPQV